MGALCVTLPRANQMQRERERDGQGAIRRDRASVRELWVGGKKREARCELV